MSLGNDINMNKEELDLHVAKHGHFQDPWWCVAQHVSFRNPLGSVGSYVGWGRGWVHRCRHLSHGSQLFSGTCHFPFPLESMIPNRVSILFQFLFFCSSFFVEPTLLFSRSLLTSALKTGPHKTTLFGYCVSFTCCFFISESAEWPFGSRFQPPVRAISDPLAPAITRRLPSTSR